MRTQPVEKTPAPVAAPRKNPSSRTVTPASRFFAELGRMCALMCVGGGILSFATFQVASWLGYPNLIQQAPELSAAIITIWLALPMAIYMAVRGHWCFVLLGLRGHQFRACFLNGDHAGARGDGAV